MNEDPKIYPKARKALESAGFDVSDPAIRGLVALVNFGFKSPCIIPDKLPTVKVYRALRSKMSAHLGKIRELLKEAKLAGVTDAHLASVPAAAERNHKRAYGELIFYPEHGWRYVAPDRSYLGARATFRLAVISGLKSAVWQADLSRRHKKGNRKRVPILSK